jgi:hypothetical protein
LSRCTERGQAAVIAANLADCLELIIADPYWQDILTRSRGDLEAMRRMLQDDLDQFEEEVLDDDPEIAEYRGKLRTLLDLREPRDPAKLLHHAMTVLGADVVVRSTQDGHPSEPLVGTFSWRPQHPAR